MNMGVYCLPCIILVSALSSVALSEEEKSMVHSVNRRLSGDIYNTITLPNSTCSFACSDGGNLTFVVSERRCVSNEEFFDGEQIRYMQKVNMLIVITFLSQQVQIAALSSQLKKNLPFTD